MIVELKALKVPKLILQSMNEDIEKNFQINFLFDKLSFIDSITNSVNTEISIVLEIIQTLQKCIQKEYKLNIFASCPNPLRLFVLIVKLLRTLDANITAMSIDLNLLQEEMEAIALGIITSVSSTAVLKNWLNDDFDGELKVIDYLAHLDLLKILSHVKIAKAVEQIWTGNYDQRKKGSLVRNIKESEYDRAYRNLNTNFDRFMTILGLHN